MCRLYFLSVILHPPALQMVRLSKALTNAHHASLASKVRDQLAEFREYVPVVLALCNPGMRGRHWEALSAAVGSKVAPGDDLVLNKLLQGGILKYMEALQVRYMHHACVHFRHKYADLSCLL